MKTFIEMAGDALEPQGNASDRYNKEIGNLFQKWYLDGLTVGLGLESEVQLEAAVAEVKKTGRPL